MIKNILTTKNPGHVLYRNQDISWKVNLNRKAWDCNDCKVTMSRGDKCAAFWRKNVVEGRICSKCFEKRATK